MSLFVFDFETALIEPGLQIPPPVCMSAALSGGSRVLLAEDGIDLLERALANGDLIVNLNVAFDLAVACVARPSLVPAVFAAYDADLVVDVGVRQKLIDIAMGYERHRYALATLAKDLLGRHLEKEDTWRLRYWDLAPLPLEEYPQEAIDYCENDAITARDLYLFQQTELEEIDRLCVLDDQYRQSRADFALHLISSWGLRSDAEGCKILRTECETRQAEIEGELFAANLLRHKFKGRKPNKVIVGVSRNTREAQALLLRAVDGDYGSVRLTEAGEKARATGASWQQIKYLSMDAEACEDSGDRLLGLYTEYTQLGNMLSGFVKAIEQGIDKPIHTHFEVLLKTGRTSSSAPNVQNVRTKEGSRECFVPREGFCFIGCDIDRAELHTLAQVCINLFGASSLADTLNAGIDPHTRFGARLAGCSYKDLKARIAAGDEEAKDLRKRAKPANFGFPGGMGPKGMMRYAKSMYKIELELSEAQELHGEWKEEYPEISGQYLGWIGRLVRGEGVATIEHFDSKRWRGQVPYCATANSFFQGLAADALKKGLWDLAKKCYMPGTALYGCRVVNEVHDDTLTEAPLSIAADAALEVQRTMVDAYNTFARDVPVSATPVLMDRWSKKAVPVLENGRLQVWRYRS